jgi:hypothetical protein
MRFSRNTTKCLGDAELFNTRRQEKLCWFTYFEGYAISFPSVYLIHGQLDGMEKQRRKDETNKRKKGIL